MAWAAPACRFAVGVVLCSGAALPVTAADEPLVAAPNADTPMVSGTGEPVVTPPVSGSPSGPARPPQIDTPAVPRDPAAPATGGPTPLSNSIVPAGDKASQTQVVLENADSLSQTIAGQWIARGNVRVRYRDYEIVADRADIDADAGTVAFTGNVVLHGPNDEEVRGGKSGAVLLDSNANTYNVVDASAIIGQRALQTGLLQPVHVYGGAISGKTDFFDARESIFTTCDFEAPHYYFKARDLYVIPGKRLVGRHVTLYRRNRALVTIPYFFVPLDQRFSRQTLAPVLGQSPEEGYYAKFGIAYLLGSALPGILQIDAMQKKGLGTGFTQNYGSSSRPTRGSGVFSLYHLKDKSVGADNFNGSLNHRQRFGTLDVGINSQFQQNSYFLSNSRSKSYSHQLTINRNVGNLSDTLIANASISDYGTGQSQNITSSLNQVFRPTQRETLTTRLNLTDSKSTAVGGTSTQSTQLDSNIQYDQREKAFDLTLTGNKFTQLKNTLGGQFFGGLEKLPEVRLTSDPTRLTFLHRYLPQTSRLDFAVGDYIEPSSKTNLKRIHFGLDTGQSTIKLTGGTKLDVGAGFTQRFYSDDTAQYTLAARTAYRVDIGQKSNFTLNYNYLRPYGYTPFQFDFSGNSNLASANLSLRETTKFQLTATSGYDFNALKQRSFGSPTPWQTLAVQSLWLPSRSFGLRTSGAFDPNHGQLVDLTNNFRIRGSDGFLFYAGTRYAPQQHKFANINGQLDWKIITDRTQDAGYRIRAIGSYNGYTKQMEYKGLAVSKLWHDWEATVIYQNNSLGATPGPSVTFNLNLRALPTYEPFAIGNYGQAIDTGLGTTL